MTLEKDTVKLLGEALETLEHGFAALPDFASGPDPAALRGILLHVAEKMRDNYPYHHPFYAGQMLKPPHPIARLAYALSLWINPNNHALDGGRASSHMEKEAVAHIARMFGWDVHLGHLCGGGTMANLEALWIAGSLDGGKTVLASQQAHYTHGRLCGVLRLPFDTVACDRTARMDPEALESRLRRGDVGTVVATIGTTATGSVDPLPEILRLRSRYGFRIHADAAYGGFFLLADNLDHTTRDAYRHLHEVDSIVVDPHKHGLQPYGCGCVLFKDPSEGRFYRHDSPYTYFTSDELHLGEISLECSRPGASAVALWATQRLLPLTEGGDFARGLSKCRHAASTLFHRLGEDPRFMTAMPPDLDILVWAPRARTSREVSRLSRAVFEACARDHLHIALASFPESLLAPHWKDLTWDEPAVTCLRCCMMKPEHLDWLDPIWRILDGAASEVMPACGPGAVP